MAEEVTEEVPRASGVHVNDSFQAREELRRIERLASRGQWADATRRYQEVVDRHGDKLVAADDELFVGVPRYVASRVASLPAAGVDAYRWQHEVRAQAAAQEAAANRDIGALLRVLEDYFCTAAAGWAGERAAELLAEDGHFASAANVLSWLMAQHPDHRGRPPQSLARLGVLLAWQGRFDQARALADELREKAPGAAIYWGGATRSAADLIAEQIARPIRPMAAAGFSWPTLGGGPSRDRVISSAADAGAVLWSIPLVSPADGSARQEVEGGDEAAVEELAASMIPCLSDGVLYFQDVFQVWSVDLERGRVRWRYESPEHAGERDRFHMERGLPGLYSPSVADGRLFAVLGAPGSGYFGSISERDRSALICLEADGQLAWRLRANRLGHEFARVQFNPAPLVDGGKVFVTARRHKTSGFEDCFLVRADARSGGVDWQVHLGSAAIGGHGFRIPTLSVPAMNADLVFACTNLGTVAAVDAWTGRIRWLRRYERVALGDGWAELPGAAFPFEPWEYHPPICWRDSIVALPTDSQSLLLISQTDGRLLQAVPRSQLHDPVTLLGIVENRLLAAGRELACWDLQHNELLWSRPRPDSPLRGRPAISESAVYWPCRDYLARWDLATGAEQRTAWASPGMAGNLLLTPQQIVVVSETQVSLLEQKSQAFERLRRQIAAAPSDPLPLLDLAEVALRADDPGVGAAALGEAIKLAGGSSALGALDNPSLRRRLYEACIAYGDRFRRSPESLSQAIGWYRRAGEFAPTIDEQVGFRLKLAATLEEVPQPTDAIRIYRQLLTDRSLRDYQVGDENAPMRTAGRVSTDRISHLIEAYGREAYEPFEREASALLAQARQAGDVQTLVELVEHYPNSQSAADALVAIGRLERQRSQYLSAARVLYRALTDYPASVDGPSVVMLIADSYRLAGNPEAALSWLARGARDYPSARLAPPGGSETTSFAALSRAWREELPIPGEPRPILFHPLRPGGEADLPPAFELLEPLFDEWSISRRTVYLGYLEGAVGCYSVLTGEPIWRKPAACRVRPNLLVMTRDLAVLATKHEVFGLRLSDGQRMWTRGQYPADIEKAETDPEWFVSFAGHVWGGGRLISLQDDNRATLTDVQTGVAEWEAMLPARPQGAMALNEELFVFAEVAEGLRTGLHVLDAATGEVLRKIDFQVRDSVLPGGLHFTAEGTLLVVTAKTMSAFDPHRGDLLWHVTGDGMHQIDTLSVGIDGVFVSQDAQQIIKRSLTDGRVLWTSPPIDPEQAAGLGMSVWLEAAHLYVTTNRHVVMMDAQDGRILEEEPVLPVSHKYVYRRLLGNCVVLVEEAPGDDRAGEGEVRKLRARMIPLPAAGPGGAWRHVIDLGDYDRRPDAFFVGDHALLLFLPGHVRRWVDATVPAAVP